MGFSLYLIFLKTKSFHLPYVRFAYICVVLIEGVIISVLPVDASAGRQQQSPPSTSSDVDKIGVEVEMEEEMECVICLSEYEEDDEAVTLKPCHHNFHVDCIRRWLQCKLRCPICNACPLQEFVSPAQNDVVLQIPPTPRPVAD
ncbi:hypothetical protein SUGI_1194560 [Cryptomeria japonica]|nr:hypothetical protein SUGI_1194560 [Cryptomeria japonica]